jgi:cytochrome c553
MLLHIKTSIVAGLVMGILFGVPAAFADEDTNPLTGKEYSGVDSAEAVMLRSGNGSPAVGKQKSLLCQGCHGENGISLEPLVPSLAGQYSRYIEKEIHDYQAGTRSHQIMNAMAGTLNKEEDIADIAAYFASRNKMKGEGAENETGKNLFLHGDISRTVVGCINCHGVRGKGLTPNTSTFPVIGGQNKAYVRRQLTLFRDGVRTNSPSGVMNKIARHLTDEEINALAEYVSVQ